MASPFNTLPLPRTPADFLQGLLGLQGEDPRVAAARTGPQGQNEAAIAFATRNLLNQVTGAARNAWTAPGNFVLNEARAALDTPAAAATRQQAFGQLVSNALTAGPAGQGGGATPGLFPLMVEITAQSESGNRERDAAGNLITSPAGAQGRMQVMPGTNRDPGFGVRPAQDGSDAERSRVGRDYLAAMMERYAGDPAKAWAAYNWGPGNVDAALQKHGVNWLQSAPAETQAYVAKNTAALSGAPTFGSPPPGMDAYMRPFNQGMALLDQAEQSALQPFSATVPRTPAPELPAPQPFQAPDFTAGNEAFAAAAPKNPFEEEGSQEKVLRRGFFRGMAEALMSTGTGPIGFGTLLMRAGMGALAGRMEGMEEVERRTEEFDKAMQQYNLALASRNDQQMIAATNTINSNIEQANAVAQRKFEISYDRWQKDNTTAISGGNLITTRPDAEGNLQYNVTPIEPIVRSVYDGQRAQAYFGLAGPTQQHSQWQWQMVQNYGLALSAMGAQMGGQTGGEAVAYGLSSQIVPLVQSGNWMNIVPADMIAQLESEAARAAGYQPAADPITGAVEPPSGAMRETMNSYIATRLVTMAMQDKELAAQLTRRMTSVAAGAVDRVQNTRQTSRTDYRGRTTTSTVVD